MAQWAGAGYGAAKGLEEVIAQRRLQQMLEAEIQNREAMRAEQQRSNLADEDYRRQSLGQQQKQFEAEEAGRQQVRSETIGMETFKAHPSGRVELPTAQTMAQSPVARSLLKVSQSLPEQEGVGPLQEPEVQRPELPGEMQQRRTNERLEQSAQQAAADRAADNARQETEHRDLQEYRSKSLAKTPRPFKDMVVQGDTGPLLVDPDTGVGRPVTTQEGQQVGAALSATERMDLRKFEKAEPVIASIEELSEKINTGAGVMAKITGVAERAAAKANYDDDVAEYLSLIEGFTPIIARALGHTGVLTQQDVDSTKAMFPKPGESKTLRNRKTKRLRTLVQGVQGATGGRGQPPPRTVPPPVGGGDPLVVNGIRFPSAEAAAGYKREKGIQ